MGFRKQRVRLDMYCLFLISLLLNSCISIQAGEVSYSEPVRNLLNVSCPPGDPSAYIAIIDACYSRQADYHSRLASGSCKDSHDHAGNVITAYKEAGGRKKVWLLTYFYKNANTDDTMAHGLGSVLRCGVKTVNISGGGYIKSVEEHELIKKLLSVGTKVYAAAGNNAVDLAEYPFYPAAYAGVIAVGGKVCTPDGRTNKSNYGVKVRRYECDHVIGQDGIFFGTSFAAPRAAGKDEL